MSNNKSKKNTKKNRCQGRPPGYVPSRPAPTETVREIVLAVTGSTFPVIPATLAALKGTPSYRIAATILNTSVDISIALSGLDPEDVPGARVDDLDMATALASASLTATKSFLGSLRDAGIQAVAA